MVKIEKFEDIVAWKKSGQLAYKIYKVLANCKDYGFRDQMQRASVSTMNNIAEGFERESKKEFKRFLKIARGSCGETRSMSYLALKLKYLDKNDFRTIFSLTIEISKIITGLIKKI